MQKMLNDSSENKFIAVWQALFNQTMVDLQSYFNLAYESTLLGGIIFDNEFAKIAKVIARSLFIKTYYTIFEEQKKNGTINAHLYILYAIFGSDALIYIEQKNPLHVQYNIWARSLTLSNWVTRAGDEMVTRDGDNIAFRTIIAELSNAELAKLLKMTSNYGSIVNFDIVIEDNPDYNDYGLVTDSTFIAKDYGLVTVTETETIDYGSVAE